MVPLGHGALEELLKKPCDTLGDKLELLHDNFATGHRDKVRDEACDAVAYNKAYGEAYGKL